jgi:dTMP kinase
VADGEDSGGGREPGAPVRGRFITIDGPDGGGKTTQAQRLADALRARGLDVLLTREPGGTKVGDRVRNIVLDNETGRHAPITDALLFNAARAQHVAEVILPALRAGRTVVCARYADSTLAYQGYGGGIALVDLRAIQAIATGGLLPDRTILLDLPPAVGLARKRDEQTRFEVEFDVAFHQRVRDGFLEMARAEPGRFRVIDATAGADQVFAQVLAAAEGGD